MNTTSESLLFRLQSLSDEAPDDSAWQQFVKLYTPLIFHWARKTGLGQGDAADLVQEVLLRVFQKLPELRYDRTRSFRGWLRTITLNKFREMKRKRSAGEAATSRSVLEAIAPVRLAESTWDLDYARLLVAESMKTMRADFADSTWEALKIVAADGESVEAAAEATGVSRWTIYSAKARLLQRLRKQLDGLI